jgi:hypothetical protein
MRYDIARSAAIESQSDSGSHREVSTNSTREIVTLTSTEDSSSTAFTAAVDMFSSTTQGLIGPVQPVQLPVQVSGILSDSGLTVTRDGSGDRCNPVSSAVVRDLHNLLTRFPALLSRGMTWRDSVITTGCQGAIPTTSRTTRAFVVSGESELEGRPVLVVQRSDTIQAQGEGAQQQHPVKLNARGIGSAVYYLDTGDGRVVRLTTTQNLAMTITTSSRANHFRQSSMQDFRLAR